MTKMGAQEQSSDGTGLAPSVTRWVAITLIVVTTGVLLVRLMAVTYQGTWEQTALWTVALVAWAGFQVPWHLRRLPSSGPPTPDTSP